MHILCPHCHNPIEVVKINANEEIACPSCGSSFHLETDTTTDPENGAPQKLGRFELMGVLGRGAFGTVYKARDPELDRTVAVKMPRAGNLAGPQELDRFLREARSAAQLRHSSIVTVHEVGQRDGLPYLVSDFVQGVTLADLLSARRPGFREAAELAAAVADALQYAHEQGVVHRDIKPSNIMIGADGRPCVMDFGLAKRETGEITMTVEGQVLGTPAYMSPEQARGEGHVVDGRGDVNSLGVVLYQLLTGELPFRGTQRMLLHQVLHDEPRSPRSLNDRISRDLETVCLKAMAKEPARRYQLARNFADDLRRWLKGEPIQARPVGRVERAVRWVKRRPAAASLLAISGVALLAMVGLIIGLVYNSRLTTAYQSEAEARAEAETARLEEEQQRRNAEEALGTAEVANKKAEAALALADRIGYFHSVFLADLALKENNLTLAMQRLKECKPELRNWEWRYLNGRCHSELFAIPGHSAVFSPDGSRLAAAGGDGAVRVYDARTGAEALVLKGPVPLTAPAFSPDGSRLAAAGGDGAVRVYDARTGAEALTLKGPVPLGAPVFSPDVVRIALAPARPGREGLLWVYSAPQDTSTWQAERCKALVDNIPTWHRNQAIESDRTGQWFVAAFHWERLAQAEPVSGQPHFRRGLALAYLARTAEARAEFETALALKKDLSELDQADSHARLGLWDEAARLYEKAVAAPNAPALTWQRHALLRLHRGDHEGYRQACASMMSRFGKSTNASVANGTAWTCALGPEALPDLRPAAELARLAVRANATDANTRNTLGAILYRAGEYREAVAALNETVKLRNNQGATAADGFFLAMAQHRLGQADEARQWLDRARQEVEKIPSVRLYTQMESRLLHREAEALIEGIAPAQKK
jgi:tetratricopeptide (TPR) repeat protein/tRNA A-37 threonylcarbamoyl transferase component Bud32